MFVSTNTNSAMESSRTTLDMDEREPETPISSAPTVFAPSYPPSLNDASIFDGKKILPGEVSRRGEFDLDVETPYSASIYSTPNANEDTEKATNQTPHPSSLHPSQSQSQPQIPPPVSLPREIAFISILCLAQLFTQASLAQTIAPLHLIGATFSLTSPSQLSWFPAAYSLTVGTFILIAGRLGDLYGHKRFFIAGWIWYGIWSLLAGFSVYINTEKENGATSVVFFDVCRGLQGIGPAFLLPNALAILGRTYEPGRRKEMVFSIFGATAPSGFVLGAVFASLFAEGVGWPWGFWVMGMLCFAIGVASHFAIPYAPSPMVEVDEERKGMWEKVDGMGCVTGVSALVLINFAWNQGPVVGWGTPYVYTLLISGFLFLALFAWVESRASHPLIPISALSKDTAFVLGCMAAGWSSFGIWVFYSWQFLEELRHTSPLLASAQFVPCAFSGLAAALTTGHVLHRVGPSIVMMVAMTAFTVGLVLMATAPVNQTYWAQTFISICIMPWGMDMSFPAATILLSDRMGREHQGVAASLVNTVINYSVSIGLGFAGTIESQVNKGGEDLLSGYRGAWYMGIGLAGLGICVAVLFGGSQLSERRRVKDELEL